MSRNIKAGKIALPMDVRSSNDVPAFENMLSKGPMAVVLVYADWCGHCTNYKKNVWSPLKSMKNRTVNMASVHYDQLENTSLKNSKIDGYPSLLLVGQDKKPATFGSTNAMPNANDMNTMKKVVASPKANTVSSLNVSNNSSRLNNSDNSSVTSNLINTGVSENTELPSLSNTKENTELPSLSNTRENTELPSLSNTRENTELPSLSNTRENTELPSLSNAKNNTNVTTNSDLSASRNLNSSSAVPPSIEADEIVETPETSPRVRTSNQGTTPLLRGGRLYRRLSLKKGKKAHRKHTKKSKAKKQRK